MSWLISNVFVCPSLKANAPVPSYTVVETTSATLLSLSLDDLNENCKYVKNTNFKGHIEQMKYFFNEGKVYFNNIENKKLFYEIIKLL